MDKWWQPEMGRVEGVELLRKCIDEVARSESGRPVLTPRTGNRALDVGLMSWIRIDHQVHVQLYPHR